MSFISKILISSDFEMIKEKIQEEYKESILKFIPKTVANEFLMDDAKEVQKESFLAENKEKIIVIMANSFKNEAQNFLLKLFEEPPKNIKFLLVCPSKNLLLPTVRSRFIIEKHKTQKNDLKFDLDIQNLDLKSFFAFLQKNENMDKVELMELIKYISLSVCKNKSLNDEELEYFYKFYELARLNSRPSLILSAIFLLLQDNV
ncbi:DNA polymerase III subunit delta' [uncultured Campylobacter sp.]|uniref:DNA polymerase III subunit delta' n=1 Tax=uncultured Campylobacter sp. TaxID=218934 RepID=UPI00262DA62A|nr:DNA polymerase III subunit delta' [uncultured Campylobacter sp.]